MTNNTTESYSKNANRAQTERSARPVLIVLVPPAIESRWAMMRKGERPHPLDFPAGVYSDSTIARISRFSKTEFPGSPFLRTTTSTIARAKSSARITWFGKSARNTG
jgi:hypothetical protein